MGRPSTPVCLLLASLISGAASAVCSAQESPVKNLPPTDYSVEIGIGGEYDSNVTVDEVDLSSSQSDYALTMDAELKARQDFSDDSSGSLTYDFSQSLYQEFSIVDRQTHLLGADFDTKLSKVRAGMSLYYIHSRLDGDPFLTLYRASPSLSGFINKKWFARGAYVYADKRIESNSLRNAITDSVEGDLYYFRRGLRSYFNLGYKYKDEDARSDRLDYSSQNAKLRYVHRFEVLSQLAKFEISWRYEDRDYSSITPSIEEKRRDRRHRWRANFELPVMKSGAIQFYYGYGDYDSNYPSADYDQDILGTRFTYRWD